MGGGVRWCIRSSIELCLPVGHEGHTQMHIRHTKPLARDYSSSMYALENCIIRQLLLATWARQTESVPVLLCMSTYRILRPNTYCSRSCSTHNVHLHKTHHIIPAPVSNVPNAPLNSHMQPLQLASSHTSRDHKGQVHRTSASPPPQANQSAMSYPTTSIISLQRYTTKITTYENRHTDA